MQPILLVESDDEVISDVTHSLKLVNIPLEVARSYDEARAALAEKNPCITITRRALYEDAEGGARFAREASSSGRFAPLVLLAGSTDEDLSDDERAHYREVWELPVVFPLFTKRVQDLLARLVIERRNFKKAAGALAESSPAQGASESTGGPVAFVLLSEVLREVVDRFEQEPQFHKMGRAEALARIEEVVAGICRAKGEGR